MEGLTPGFRFYPTEEELISFYLRNKLDSKGEELNTLIHRVIPILDVYAFNPWELPQYAGDLCHGDPEQCFFFIPRQESECRGGRPNRLTKEGYWKATGSPGRVYSKNSQVIGEKRTMVFYIGRAPNGSKTDWKMNEYKAVEGDASSHENASMQLRHEFSLCRVYKKSKTLRSFDRRPTGDLQAFQPHTVATGDHYGMATKFSPQDNKPPAAERMSSPDSLCFGSHVTAPSEEGAETITNMEAQLDDLWDWEQLLR